MMAAEGLGGGEGDRAANASGLSVAETRAALEKAVQDLKEGQLALHGTPFDKYRLSMGFAAAAFEAILARPEQDPTALNEAIAEFDDRLTSWSGAYPVKVFPEPDMQEVRGLLAAGGVTLDSVSASNMRHVVTRLNELFNPVRAALQAFNSGASDKENRANG